jgi:hypothetical protein
MRAYLLGGVGINLIGKHLSNYFHPIDLLCQVLQGYALLILTGIPGVLLVLCNFSRLTLSKAMIYNLWLDVIGE